jgi:predicted subunit of tRNA(5-methylaminomethyl-2-thiouridylate) methyltransferase
MAKLTTTQLQAMLDAKIRDRARWRIKDAVEEGEPGSLVGGTAQVSVSSKKLKQVASRIYDDMMGDLSWSTRRDESSPMLDAINSMGEGKFSVAYVQRVIKKALKSDMLSLESAELDARVADLVTEMCGKKLHGKKVRRKKKG